MQIECRRDGKSEVKLGGPTFVPSPKDPGFRPALNPDLADGSSMSDPTTDDTECRKQKMMMMVMMNDSIV